MEVTPENIRYKQTIDGMAKHIVYGNIYAMNYVTDLFFFLSCRRGETACALLPPTGLFFV